MEWEEKYGISRRGSSEIWGSSPLLSGCTAYRHFHHGRTKGTPQVSSLQSCRAFNGFSNDPVYILHLLFKEQVAFLSSPSRPHLCLTIILTLHRTTVKSVPPLSFQVLHLHIYKLGVSQKKNVNYALRVNLQLPLFTCKDTLLTNLLC